MKNKRLGGGHYICSRCRKTIFGSALHNCKSNNKLKETQNNMSEETITITQKEYDELTRDQRWLSALESAGVDNWDGYDYAQELFQESEAS